jgi:hypothetical protein
LIGFEVKGFLPYQAGGFLTVVACLILAKVGICSGFQRDDPVWVVCGRLVEAWRWC